MWAGCRGYPFWLKRPAQEPPYPLQLRGLEWVVSLQPGVTHAMVHEAGHALVLSSFGDTGITIDEVNAVRTATAGGATVLSVPLPQGELPGVWGLGAPAFDSQAEAALAITQFGGMAAEQEIFGKRPNQGWSNDLLDAVVRLGRFGGVAREALLWLSSEATNDADFEAIAKRAAVEFARLGVLDVRAALQALQTEAKGREGFAAT